MIASQIGDHIIKLDSVDSTNNYAMNIAKNKNPDEGTIVWANEQNKGRGQKGNLWLSEQGKNLIFSIITKPDFLEIHKQFYLSKIISLAISDFLKKYVNNIFIKWPNDIYINNDKIAGILIENLIKGNKIIYSIAGIGININQVFFKNSLPNPISLKKLTEKDYSLEKLASQLFKMIESRYQELKKIKFESINKEYINSLYMINKDHYFKFPDGSSLKGKIRGVNNIGMLLIETDQKEIKEFNFKEISF